MNEPRDHHHVPQFFLRNFAIDAEKRKVTTVAKTGDRAIWSERSIEGLGFERDLYVHFQAGVPVSVESVINSNIETPISQSDTWAKIASGRSDALDRSDKPILYALVRHFEARSPHYLATQHELANLAALPDGPIQFTPEERRRYAAMRTDQQMAKQIFNHMSASLAWTENSFKGSGLTVMRSKLPLRSSSVPVLAVPAPEHPAIRLPLPGMMPYAYLLTLDPHTIVSLVLGEFDDGFVNIEIQPRMAMAFNRYFVGQFGHFPNVRHLLTSRQDLSVDMGWAHFETVKDTPRKIVFRRRTAAQSAALI